MFCYTLLEQSKKEMSLTHGGLKMQTNLEAIDRMEDRTDCPEKALYYKWLRAAEYQTGGTL